MPIAQDEPSDLQKLGLTKIQQDFPLNFHHKLFSASLWHQEAIKRAYKDVLGLNYIQHLSINVINPKNEILFLSSTPTTALNIFRNELIKYDNTLHPTVFKNKAFYWWDECYTPTMAAEVKWHKERRNGLACGFILTEKINDYHFMYSYGAKKDNPEIRQHVLNLQDYFLAAGKHCYERIQSIHAKYEEIPDFS